MNRDSLGDWLQILGMLAIVASLVFVGLQLKQAQDIAIASQYQARLDSASGHHTALLESDPALRVIGTGILEDIQAEAGMPAEYKAWAASQPVEELAFRYIGGVIFLKSHDNVYFQYQRGFLSEEAWTALRAQLKLGLNDDRSWSRAVYEANPEVWRESYRQLIDGLLNEGQDAAR